MTQARRENTRNAISIADLNTEIDSEPRVLDTVLGERLGLSRARDVRSTIVSSQAELATYGDLPRVAEPRSRLGGRPTSAYYLNEPQALLICMFSNTTRAAEVRKMLIDVFMEYRRGKAMPASQVKPVKVKAHERRTSTKLDNAFSLARSAGRLEKVADTFEPRVQSLSMIVVDGRPVVFDPHATDLRAGDVIVGFDWYGKLIVTPITERQVDGYRPGGFRLVSALPRMEGGIKTTPSVFAIGKVVMPDVPQQAALPVPVGANDNPSLPGQYRGKRTLFRDKILQLVKTNLTNRQIAQVTGATYQTVTHWRRWSEDQAA